jgi:hypothetical protein
MFAPLLRCRGREVLDILTTQNDGIIIHQVPEGDIEINFLTARHR